MTDITDQEVADAVHNATRKLNEAIDLAHKSSIVVKLRIIPNIEATPPHPTVSVQCTRRFTPTPDADQRSGVST